MPTYKCIRRCYHPVSQGAATRRIFAPGEIYEAAENEKMPRHFKKVTKASAQEIAADIEAASKQDVPAFVRKNAKGALVHGIDPAPPDEAA